MEICEYILSWKISASCNWNFPKAHSKARAPLRFYALEAAVTSWWLKPLNDTYVLWMCDGKSVHSSVAMHSPRSRGWLAAINRLSTTERSAPIQTNWLQIREEKDERGGTRGWQKALFLALEGNKTHAERKMSFYDTTFTCGNKCCSICSSNSNKQNWEMF